MAAQFSKTRKGALIIRSPFKEGQLFTARVSSLQKKPGKVYLNLIERKKGIHADEGNWSLLPGDVVQVKVTKIFYRSSQSYKLLFEDCDWEIIKIVSRGQIV